MFCGKTTAFLTSSPLPSPSTTRATAILHRFPDRVAFAIYLMQQRRLGPTAQHPAYILGLPRPADMLHSALYRSDPELDCLPALYAEACRTARSTAQDCFTSTTTLTYSWGPRSATIVIS